LASRIPQAISLDMIDLDLGIYRYVKLMMR